MNRRKEIEKMMILLSLLSLFNIFTNSVYARECTADGKLDLQFLSTANDATCQDGSPAGYYINLPKNCKDNGFTVEDCPIGEYYYEHNVDEPEFDTDIVQNKGIALPIKTQRKFLIWLGEGDLCTGTQCDENCNVDETDSNSPCFGIDLDAEDIDITTFDDTGLLCFLRKLTCSSEDWKRVKKLTPETILCRDDPDFGQYIRVHVPMCSLDWFLGNGIPNSKRYRGGKIIEAFFDEMNTRFQMFDAHTVVLGGTFGGGIAALNHLKRLKSKMTNPASRVLGMVDSAFIYEAEGFAVNVTNKENLFVASSILQNLTKEWAGISALFDQDCSNFFGQNERYRCLIGSNLIPNFLLNESLFIMNSQYDLVILSQLGILDESKQNQFADVPSYAFALISYVEQWGAAFRAAMTDSGSNAVALSNKSHVYYSTGCPQHGYVVPTKAHRLSKQKRAFGDAGSIEFERTEKIWENISVDGVVLIDAVKAYLNSGGTLSGGNSTPAFNVRADTCGSFLCNSNCGSSIFPFAVQGVLPICMQQMVLVFAIIFLAFSYLAFTVSYLQARKFEATVAKFWRQRPKSMKNDEGKKGIVSQPMKALQLETSMKDLNDPTAKLSTESFTNEKYSHPSIARRNDDDGVELELLQEAAEGEYRKVHLMVRNMSYFASPRVRGGSKYHILKNVNIAFTPGKIHALMGPSGSGKSTLMDVMALIRDSGELHGLHYINGVESHRPKAKFLLEWLRNNVAYVRQTDILFPHITVREHLCHAAWLMLPEYMPAEKKLRRVSQVISLLELNGCADTICGDGGVKIVGGISGGQRRRVSVAAQLLRLPAAMILDEPTSGLDSTSALALVRALATLAHRGGVNVAMTIHQPRQEIFELFDELTILVAGRVVYSGPPGDSAPHFGISTKEKNISNEILDHLSKVNAERIAKYQEKYEKGPFGKKMLDNMNREVTNLTDEMARDLEFVLLENSLAEGRWSWSSPSSAPTQAWVLLNRTILRGGFGLKKTGTLAFIGGCIVGFCFFGINTATSKTAMAYLGVTVMSFLQGTFLGDRYLGEKQMFDHEANAGSSISWVAFLSSQFMRDAVTSGVEGLLFAIPFYWIGGLNLDVNDQLGQFGIFVILVLLIALTCVAQNVMVESWADNLRKAALVNVSLVGLGALFNGFIIRISDLPIYFIWIPYLMITYWGFVGVLLNAFSGVLFGSESPTALERATQSGDLVLKTLQFDQLDISISLAALLGLIFLFRTITMVTFYVKYVRSRGNQMKRVIAQNHEYDAIQKQIDAYKQNAASGASFNPSTPSEHVAGSAMASMLASKTDAARIALKEKRDMERSQVSKMHLLPDGTEAAGTPIPGNSSSPVLMRNNSATSQTLTPLNLQTSGNEEQQATVVGSETPFANASGAQFVYHNEWETNEAEKEANVQTDKASFLGAIFLSRATIMAVAFVDLALASVTCAVDGPNASLFAYYGVNFFFCGFFFIQFAYSLLKLIPLTPDGYLDCVWAGLNDGVSGALVIADIVLVVQTITSRPFVTTTLVADNQSILLVFAFLVRATRLARALLFWAKVSRYHQIRAKYWMLWYIQYLEMKKLQEVNPNLTGDSAGASSTAQAHRSLKMKQAGSRISAGLPGAFRMSMGKNLFQRGPPPELPSFLQPGSGGLLANRISMRQGLPPASLRPPPELASNWGAFKPSTIQHPPNSTLKRPANPVEI